MKSRFFVSLLSLLFFFNLQLTASAQENNNESCLLDREDPIAYSELREQAIYHCKNRRSYQVDTKIIDGLIEIERDFNVPPPLRGMLLAAACNESGFNPKAVGDGGKAHGIVQQWPWWRKKYKIDRFKYKEAAAAWMERVLFQMEKNRLRKRCPKRFSNVKNWIVGWVQTARGNSNKANRWRCYQVPSHYRILKKWHKNIIKERQEWMDDIDGCEC